MYFKCIRKLFCERIKLIIHFFEKVMVWGNLTALEIFHFLRARFLSWIAKPNPSLIFMW